MSYERKRKSLSYSYELQTSRTCNRCRDKAQDHIDPRNTGRYCDNPRYLRNIERRCGCFRTPIYQMALRQKEERDPDAHVDTHCCYCKRATKLTDLGIHKDKENGKEYEQ